MVNPKPGLEALENITPYSEFVQTDETGQHIVLRGKHAGVPLAQVPYGYVKHFIIEKCHAELTDHELNILQAYVDGRENTI